MKNKNFFSIWKKSEKIIKDKLNEILKSLSDYYIKDDIQFNYNTTSPSGHPRVSVIVKFENHEWIKHGKAKYGLTMKFELSLNHWIESIDGDNYKENHYMLQISFGDDCVYPKVLYTVSGDWEDLKDIVNFIEKHQIKVIKMVTK